MRYPTIDVRAKLARNPEGGPGRRVEPGRKRGVVVHYNGPEIAETADALTVIQADARYHVAKDWDEDPRNGAVIAGDGLMYHYAIGRDGTRYRTRDEEDVLWHCGAWPWNAEALSVLVLIGGEQRATSDQLGSLEELVEDFRGRTGTSRAEVVGHQELSATSCPGTLMGDFVRPYRAGAAIRGDRMAYGEWFGETGHFVGGAIYRHFVETGGVRLHGLPLSEEMDEACEDGVVRTVQYFERSVLEFWPENPAAYRVLGRRLGAAALVARQ